MQGRRYYVPFNRVAITAVQELLEILAPADLMFTLEYFEVSQDSDAGDAQDEQLHFSIRRVTGSPTSGSGGSTVTPAPLNPGDVASSCTCEANNTTQLSGGTNTVLVPSCFNVRNGGIFLPPEIHQPMFSPSTRCIIELEKAPADSLTASGYGIICEYGG